MCVSIFVTDIFPPKMARNKVSTKFVHNCVSQTKSNLFKQSLTKANKVSEAL